MAARGRISAGSTGKPSVASSKRGGAPPGKQGQAPPATQKKRMEFQLPAFSILPKKPKEAINWDIVKRNMIRRQAPEGEDLKGIKKILTEMKEIKIPLHDFINLISSYTADNGAALRSVSEEDCDSFRKLARKVYETMTQDVSDVLVNEQLQLMQYYQERHDVMTEKMMRTIDDIYEIAPNFDFDKYLAEKQEYLDVVLPIPAQVVTSSEIVEQQRRQAAYHRLQWLRAEGERMREENIRLRQRLDELKIEQEVEQQRKHEVAAQAEATRQDLIREEAQMKDKLDQMSKTIEKSVIENEATINKMHNVTGMRFKKEKAEEVKRKKKKKRPEWVSVMSEQIEEEGIKVATAAELEHSTPAGIRIEEKDKPCSCAKSQEPKSKIPAPQVYAPANIPPHAAQQQTRVEGTTLKEQVKRPILRRNLAPRDQWGGFR